MIPPRLIRCVPAALDERYEGWWARWCEMHPHWEHVTVRDPIDPAAWPRTGHLFSDCVVGAQIAGLVRLEALERWGGVYVDADVEPIRSIDGLRAYPCFIGTQDGSYLTDAVIGAEVAHPAITACIDRVIGLSMSKGPLVTGPDNTTRVLTGRADVTVLPVDCFYPYGFREKYRANEDFTTNPAVFAVHHWAGSWLQ